MSESFASKYQTLATEAVMEAEGINLGVRAAPELPDQYYFLGHLGHGAQGEVYEAIDRLNLRKVAIKTVRYDRRSPHSLERFAFEAATLARLVHPAIIPVYDTGHLSDGRAWYAMPVVIGTTLDEAVDELGFRVGPKGWATAEAAHPMREMLVSVMKVAEALSAAHSEGVVHRDIKPQNVLIGGLQETYLVDWGTACKAYEPAEFTGTRAYMCQSHSEGGLPTPHWDVYSLGCTLFHVLTGQHPRSFKQGEAVPMVARIEAALELSSAAKGWVPEHLVQLCARALSLAPEERPSAELFAESMRAWLLGNPSRVQTEYALSRARGRLLPAWERVQALGVERMLQDNTAFDSAGIWSAAERAQSIVARHALRAELEERYAALQEELSRLRLAIRRFELPRAHELVYPVVFAELRRAELGRQRERQAQLLGQLREHAPQGYLDELVNGLTHVTLDAGPFARLELWREDPSALTPTLLPELTCLDSVSRVPCRSGLYVFKGQAPGCAPLHFEAMFLRGDHWRLKHPTQGLLPIRGVHPDAVSENEVLVREGYAVIGGDPLAAQAMGDVRLIWIEAFVAQRDPLSNGQWADWWRGLPAEAQAQAWPSAWDFDVDALSVQDSRWRACPVGGLAPEALDAYLAAHPGWRLPHELEWEKLARGAGGRLFPWGDAPEWLALRSAEQLPPAEVDWDRSPGGARGLCSNRMELCANPWMLEPHPLGQALDPLREEAGRCRVARGGFVGASLAELRACARHVIEPDQLQDARIGVRLVRTLDPAHFVCGPVG